MAFSTEEREALLELKEKGYTKEDALGFIAASRMGNSSKVEREFTASEEPTDSTDAVSDLKQGFQGAVQAVDEGVERSGAASKRGNVASRTLGQLGAGFRAAGEATGSLVGGAIRALPGGTSAMNLIDRKVSEGVQKVATSPTAGAVQDQFNKLPEGVKQTAGDIGNIGMGALGLSEALVAPGLSKALTTGVKEFTTSGVKEFGQSGINASIKTGVSPENLMQRVARISKGKQANFEERAGQSVGEYLVDRGIFGDPEEVTSQLYQRMQTSKGRVDSGLASVQGVFKNDAVSDALEQLAEREARVSTSRTPSPDQQRVSALLKKHEGDGLTLSEINEVKRLYERNVKLDYLKDNVSDKVAQANNIDNKLRDFVEQTADTGGFKNVKALNRETFLAKQLLDDLGAEYAGQQGNNFVSLSDAFFLAEAAGNPTALAAFGLKRTLSSKKTMSAVAKLIAGKRQFNQVPDADLTEFPQLPAPREGAANVSVDTPVSLPERSQSSVDASQPTSPTNNILLGGLATLAAYYTFNEDGSVIPLAALATISPQTRKKVIQELREAKAMHQAIANMDGVAPARGKAATTAAREIDREIAKLTSQR